MLVKRLCNYCGEEFLTLSSSPNLFCSKECWRKPRTKVSNHDTLIKRLEDYHVLTVCVACGLDDYRIMVVHHKNRNRKDNNVENLEVLCPNCHALLHYLARKEGEIRGREWTQNGR